MHCVCSSCGAEDVAADSPLYRRRNRLPRRAPRTSGDGLQISGTLGHIDPFDVKATLDRKLPRFYRCIEKRLPPGGVPGRPGVELYVRIRTDGTVAWVVPSDSTLGDREAEKCILDKAAAVRFPTSQRRRG